MVQSQSVPLVFLTISTVPVQIPRMDFRMVAQQLSARMLEPGIKGGRWEPFTG